MKELVERNKTIRFYCKQGLSYRQVGSMFPNKGTPLSRQRVHQIYRKGQDGFWRALWNYISLGK